MTETKPKPLWSVPVTLANIPDTGRRFELTADASMRTALAKLAGLRALPSMQAAFDVGRHGLRGLRVSGRVEAIVGQTCSVTLEPMENKVEENVDLLFLPPGESAAEDGSAKSDAEIIDPDAPEPLTSDSVDLGAIATEFLLLGIDPYPRKPQAAFEPPANEDPSSHPFAALAALKKDKGEQDG
jgi:uncharacterized metal-binding protein YceD (DUF177 family)